MKHLVIIGARGFGREVYDLACDCQVAGATFDIKGFLDDKTDALDGYQGYPKIISSVEDYTVDPNDVFTCALGDPHWKRVYINKILSKGGTFISLISPNAIVRRNAQIGCGAIITAGSNVSVDTTIGNFVSLLSTAVGHDSVVGDYVVASGSCRINGYVTIEDDAYLGCGVLVHPHKKVGKGAFIGMGSVLISNAKPGMKYFGNPARKVEI